MPLTTFRRDHDPEAVLDYVFDWSKWLAEDETITDATVVADDGITVDSTNIGATTVTVWLSGGTAKFAYDVSCEITTSDTREDVRRMRIAVRER